MGWPAHCPQSCVPRRTTQGVLSTTKRGQHEWPELAAWNNEGSSLNLDRSSPIGEEVRLDIVLLVSHKLQCHTCSKGSVESSGEPAAGLISENGRSTRALAVLDTLMLHDVPTTCLEIDLVPFCRSFTRGEVEGADYPAATEEQHTTRTGSEESCFWVLLGCEYTPVDATFLGHRGDPIHVPPGVPCVSAYLVLPSFVLILAEMATPGPYSPEERTRETAREEGRFVKVTTMFFQLIRVSPVQHKAFQPRLLFSARFRPPA